MNKEETKKTMKNILNYQKELELENLNKKVNIISSLRNKLSNNINNSIYNPFINNSPINLFYGLIFFISIYCFFNYFKLSFTNILYISISLFITYIFLLYTINTTGSQKDIQYIQLQSLEYSPKNIQLPNDYDFISVYLQIQEFNNNESKHLINSLHNLDLFLKLYYDMEKGLSHCKQHYSNAEKIALESINYIQAYIHIIEPAKINKQKLKQLVFFLRKSYNKRLRKMISMCNKYVDRVGISTDEYYINPYKGPVAYENKKNNFDFFLQI